MEVTHGAAAERATVNVRVAVLIRSLPAYRLPLLEELRARVAALRVFVADPAYADRPRPAAWGSLDVARQRSMLVQTRWYHPTGFTEPVPVVIPYDTFAQLRRYRPDVIISSELGPRTVQALIYSRLQPKTGLVAWVKVSEHTEQARGKLRKWLRGWILSRADAVIVNGASGARYVRRFGVADDRVHSVSQTDALPTLLSVPVRRTPEQRYRLLYVGRLIELKGLLPYLAVASCWAAAHPDRTLEFWIAGDGPVRPALEAQPTPPNLHVRFFGTVAYDQLPTVYAQAGLFVFPTLSDEWGLVVNESMRAGLPVLGSVYSQAVDEMVRDGAEGWLFRPDQAEDAYRSLERALSTPPGKLEAMGQAARERVRHLTPAHMADRFVSIITRVHRG